MLQPDALKSDAPLLWATGKGTDVWNLFQAAIAGDMATVSHLVEKDPSLVRTHFHYRKPLYFAVRENQIQVAEFLLDRDPDPLGLAFFGGLFEIAADRGLTAMEQLLVEKLWSVHRMSRRGEAVAKAIRERDGQQMGTLLDAEPDLLHVADLRGNQPIHWAAMVREIPLIEALLARGADINARRPDGASPLQLNNGDYHHRGWRDVPKDHPTTPLMVLDYLKAHGAFVDICTAAYHGDEARVRELLATDPTLANRPVEYLGYYPCSGAPLPNAAAGGHLAIVRLLLEAGADPNLPEEGIAPKGKALYEAVSKNRPEVAKLLLQHGADPNAPVESSADTLSAAIRVKNQELVDLLASHGASRSVEILAYYGDVLVAAAMFAANPALADDLEALEAAASMGQEGFIRLMLKYKPDLPRRCSVGASTRELTELLFRHGMNPNVPDWLGVTQLHRFAKQGNVELATVFLDHGADIHAREEDCCSTPLGWAARFGQLAMVELLLTRGALVHHPQDPPWATPLAWARRRGHAAIVERLAIV